MALIKEDFYPKRPTRESWLDALPELTVAAYLAIAPWFVPEEAMMTMLLEMPFLMFLAVATFCATSGSAFVRWFGGIWAALFFLGIVVVSSVFTRQWSLLFGLAALLVAHIPVLVKRDKWLQRHMVGARSLVRIGLLWALLAIAPAAVGALVPATSEAASDALLVAAWGASYFVVVALLDAFRVLVPPPPGAGPGWWKWSAPSTPQEPRS